MARIVKLMLLQYSEYHIVWVGRSETKTVLKCSSIFLAAAKSALKNERLSRPIDYHAHLYNHTTLPLIGISRARP